MATRLYCDCCNKEVPALYLYNFNDKGELKDPGSKEEFDFIELCLVCYTKITRVAVKEFNKLKKINKNGF